MDKAKILITGASGYIGARLFRDLSKNYLVSGTYYKSIANDGLVKMDVSDIESVRDVLSQLQPEFVVHNAAFPVSPQNDEQKTIVENVNFLGTDNIVKVANEIGAKVIFISSAVALNKNDFYGQSKAYGESACQSAKAGSLIIRPHTVFGFSPNMLNDRSYNRLLKNIYLKTPAVYDTSWKFEPTYIGHLSNVTQQYVEGKVDCKEINVAFDVLKSKYDIGKDVLGHFGIDVLPTDDKSSRPTIKLELDDFVALNLPIRDYDEMISVMVEETRAIGDSYPINR
jgi:dTDP-4-dehydrorhamnose reductase